MIRTPVRFVRAVFPRKGVALAAPTPGWHPQLILANQKRPAPYKATKVKVSQLGVEVVKLTIKEGK